MTQPNPWMAIPFGLLLALIALGPLFFANRWGRHYPKASFGLGAVVVVYYLLGLHAGERVVEVAFDYLSFLALIGSLFVVAGGIHITVKGEATPLANVVFLIVGALTSNLIGTTGASMLLIRPWLRMNKYRVTGHHVVFFIFVVSNVGGCLTPVGDPPLYLGYLKGIPFWWVTEHCWPAWMAGVGILLAMFYLVDERNYRRAPRAVRERLAEPADQWRFDGLSNLVFLGVILGSAFIERPLFLREILMIGAAAGSYFTTSRQTHDSNNFNFHPIKEVAVLFAGIFATMMPALDWLQGNAGKLVDPTPAFFFFGSGSLSSVLDNAPTYLAFLSAIFGSFIDQEIVAQVQRLVQTRGLDLASLTGPHAEQIRQTFAALQKYHSAAVAGGNVSVGDISICFLLGNAAFHKFILAISVGSVFFGANTYIGNGPNFMVKAIADQNKVHTPTFLGYVVKYTLPFMVPMLVIIWWIFFRG
ncbi:MAG: sodium:proton antiporter [Verrucomicrobiota bacterium]